MHAWFPETTYIIHGRAPYYKIHCQLLLSKAKVLVLAVSMTAKDILPIYPM